MKKNGQKHFFEKFNWSNIFILNLKRSATFIAIPIILINIFAMVYYYKNISLEYSASSKQILSSVENIIAGTKSDCEDIFNMISSDLSLNVLMQAEKIEDFSGARSEPITKLRNILQTQAFYSDYISSIDIYSIKSQYVLSSLNSGKINFIKHKPWYGVESDELFYMVNDGDSFCICYNVVNEMKKAGLIIFHIDTTPLKAVFMNVPDKKCNLSLYDKNNRMFFDSGKSNTENAATELPDSDYELKHKNKFTQIFSAGEDISVSLVVEHAHPVFTQLVLMAVITIMILFVLSLIFAYILSKQLYRSIQEIAVTINDISDDSSPERTKDEIAYINHNILSMKSKNQMLEQELVKSFVELKKMQTKTLQMQFTPHFLFNALNTLNASIMLKLGVNTPESKSIETIAEMLTASLDVNNYMVTVKEEIEHCKKYVKIQSLISNNNFDILWNVRDDIKNLMTVKFSLQPIIENAFKHGIRHLHNKSKGFLSVSAFRVGQNLVFEIENNGPTPDGETLNEINTMLASSQNPGKNHVGLFNVNKRIHLVFGEEYGCSIEVRNSLTLVRVTIPVTTDADISSI